jgi:octopine/nopaline transport system substrate-binding protein
MAQGDNGGAALGRAPIGLDKPRRHRTGAAPDQKRREDARANAEDHGYRRRPAFGVGSAAAAQTWTKVKIGTEGAYPPWNYTDSSGQLIGSEIDLARDLCSSMQVECELVAQDWERVIPALQAGQYDAIMAGMPITDQRKKLIQFSESYAALPAYFAVLESSEPATFGSELEGAQLDRIEAVEQSALDALKQAFAGRIVGVQVATPACHLLEEYRGDVVEIR